MKKPQTMGRFVGVILIIIFVLLMHGCTSPYPAEFRIISHVSITTHTSVTPRRIWHTIEQWYDELPHKNLKVTVGVRPQSPIRVDVPQQFSDELSSEDHYFEALACLGTAYIIFGNKDEYIRSFARHFLLSGKKLSEFDITGVEIADLLILGYREEVVKLLESISKNQDGEFVLHIRLRLVKLYNEMATELIELKGDFSQENLFDYQT